VLRQVSLILILLSLSLTALPADLAAQAAGVEAGDMYEGLGLVGFKRGLETIPVNGTSIPLFEGETVWLLALRDVSVDYGPVGGGPVVHLESLSAGEEVPLTPPSLPCCGASATYSLKITAHPAPLEGGLEFERAYLIYVGVDEQRTLTASIYPGNDSLQVMLDGVPLTPSTRLALLKPGVDEVVANGLYGEVKYRSVIKPHSTLQIIYDPSKGLIPKGSVVRFLLLSTRAFVSEGEGLENGVKLHRDGIVASAVVDLNRTAERPIVVNLTTSAFGEPGVGGDTPLQPGLHFLYIHIEGQELARRDEEGNLVGSRRMPYGGYGDYAADIEALSKQIFIPIYVLDDDGYTLLDHTIASKEMPSLDFSKAVPNEVLVAATTSIQGVTSSIYKVTLTVPVARIALYDGVERVDEYTVNLKPSLPSANIQGVTYVIGESLGQKALLTGVKVNNFTLTNYKIEGGRSGVIVFPDVLNLTAKLNKVTISAEDELGEPVAGGLIRLEKGGEVYTLPADRPRIVRLPDGTYKVSLLIGGVSIVERTVRIESPQTVLLTVSTVQATDIALLALILAEASIAVILLVKIFQSSRRRVQPWTGRV